MRFQDLPIRRKLVGLILLVSLTVLLVAAVVMLVVEFRTTRRDMAARLTAVAEIICANSSAVLVFDDAKVAQEILLGLQAEPDVVAAALYDKHGRLYARYPVDLPMAKLPGTLVQHGPRFGANAFTLYEPVMQSENQVGTLFLKADYRQMYYRLLVYGVVLLLVLTGSGVLALFLSNLFESRISQPLLQLAKVAQAVSEKKDYSVRATKSGQDELGILTDAFNAMLAQIQTGDAAVRESERRFRMIADNISVLAWTADRLGVGTWYNKRWYDYTGLSFEESRAGGWERLHHPEHLAQVNRSLQEALERGEPWEDTFPLRGSDGQYRWFLSRAVPIFDDAGCILRWFGTNVDVTELREAEQSVVRLAAIVESSHDAIVSKSLNGVIRTWNRGAELMFGYLAAEVIGKPITILIPEERLEEEAEILTRQRRGETIENFETVRVRKDGTRFEVSLSISPLRDRRGHIIGISKIARDITERKRAERELQKALEAAQAANRAKDDFLAALSHELRTPLMPVLFTISVLQQDRSLPSNLRSSLGVVRRNIEIQSRMINDLLDLSRIRANRLELNRAVIDLHDIVFRAYEVCRSHAKFSELSIALKLEAGEHFVHGDADRLQQVFWNLIQNAMKFTPAGGQIIIQSSQQEDVLRVTVTDTGCGIEPELLVKIFEPFEQGGRKSKESLQGLGLGLAIAQRIVKAHGGTLTVSSPGTNCGTTFTLELKLVPAPPDAGPAAYQPELMTHPI
jgi:PAS domain S-box-containing protein